MKIISIIIALLSIAAGMAKVTQTPQEIQFLNGLGLNNTMILAFGLLQVIGGMLTMPTKTRLYGASCVVVGFFISAILVFASGNYPFGILCKRQVIASGFILYRVLREPIESHHEVEPNH